MQRSNQRSALPTPIPRLFQNDILSGNAQHLSQRVSHPIREMRVMFEYTSVEGDRTCVESVHFCYDCRLFMVGWFNFFFFFLRGFFGLTIPAAARRAARVPTSSTTALTNRRSEMVVDGMARISSNTALVSDNSSEWSLPKPKPKPDQYENKRDMEMGV